MYSALYYPHINIRDNDLIRDALLLWDKLEYITPSECDTSWHEDDDYNDALSLISEPHVPSDEEKESAHSSILELATSDLPAEFSFNPTRPWDSYNIFPQKLLPKTWDMLSDLRLANKHNERFLTSASLGFSIMSILADNCAGLQKQLITDETNFYSALTRYFTEINGGIYKLYSENNAAVGSPELYLDDVDRLVTISMKTINLNNIDIKSLISYRRKEKEENASHLRTLRHNYLDKLMEYAAKLANEAKTENDKKEIERQFEEHMKDDLNNLCEELKVESKKVIFSKEMAVAVVATAGTFIEPITSVLIGCGALYKKKVEYKAARRKALSQRPMAWLFESKKIKLY
ncbi:hypothetical protein KAR91_75995 [Candidatus Pacearchaeota archaeon]|nr:hypothetical protein [Candidatus Pacearchaeota archaeon]